MRSLILILILSVISSNAQNNAGRKHKSFSDSIRNFQLNLLANTGTNIGQHLVIAPFSVWALMAVLAEGTKGETNKQLRNSIGKILNQNYSHEGFANVTKFFQQKSSVTVERTSCLFHHSNIVIYPNYARKMKTHYGMNVVKINASQPQLAAMQINEYFRNATHGRITQVVEPKDFIDTRVILTETVYFKGNWMKSFNDSSTNEQNFYNDAGVEMGKVNMMYQRTSLGIANMETLRGHVLELPYGDRDQFVMLVMLPYHGVHVLDMYARLSNVTFAEIFKQLSLDEFTYSTEDVDVWLPRFKITTNAHLATPLNMAGIERIFTKEADFSKMTNDTMYVTDVFHKAEIEVTEKGTVASAVSGAEFAHRTTVPKFRADRPFLFIILEKSSQTILFSGIYSQPSLF